MTHQKDATKSGYWPLYRFHPSAIDDGQPFQLDSRPPSMPVRDFVASETRFAILARTDPERAAHLAALAQADVDERWRYYTQLAGIQRTVPHEEPAHIGPMATTPPAVTTRGASRERRPDHALPRPHVALAGRRIGGAAATPSSAMVGRLDAAGVGAIVLPSLFEEEILARGAAPQPVARPGLRPVRGGAGLLPGGHRGCVDR